MKTQIVLPADEFDALELAAMEFGGVAHGRWFRPWTEPTKLGYDADCPMCVNGLAIFAGLDPRVPADRPLSGYESSVPTHITVGQNDDAVEHLIAKGRYTVAADGVERVSWADYCEALNIIRGD